jgi:bacterioferritin
MKATERIAMPAGAIANVPRADRSAVLRLLKEALAAELICVLRYRRHHFMARALDAQRIAEEFLVHSDEELSHADLIAGRIVQLGGEPDFSPATLAQRSGADYVPASTVVDMIRENLLAEHLAIDGYRRLTEEVGEADPLTRRMLEGIISVEQAHAAELSDLLQGDMRGT